MQNNQLFLALAEILKKALALAFPQTEEAQKLSLEQIAQSLTEPPDKSMGHFAFPCFQLSKALRGNPAQIAKTLNQHIAPTPLLKSHAEAGPYINFFLQSAAMGSVVAEKILDGSFFHGPLVSSPQKVMIEYSQPNTHKELHVGHMRNLCLGNAIVRLNRYVGHQTTAVTYPGDVGTHVAKCLWYLKYVNKTPAPSGAKGTWLGEMYSKAHNLLEDQKGTEKEDQNRQELTAILKQLEKKEGEYFQLWKETREWSIELMKSVYQWAGVSFDRWFFESECDAPSLAMARQLLKEGKLIESEGAVGMDLSEDKLGFCMMIKRDGTGLYATKDVLLAQKKFEEYHLDRNIYVVDVRQALHFKQVFKVLEKLGFAYAKNCFHLEYDFVELPSGAMSSRKGNIIPMTDLIQNMESTIKSEYLCRYKDEWSQEEIDQTARIIANGAIKYGMNRMDHNRKIVFDMKEWLKLDGETGPYLQYACARINSVTKKLNATQLLSDKKYHWEKLEQPNEGLILAKLSQLNSTVVSASQNYKVSHLCAYLYDLSKLYNNFYAENPIAKAESNELMKARLALSIAVYKVMKQGLELLGIETPERM